MSDANIGSAIAAALASDWKKAAEINQILLKENPNNIDCLNRLGKALLEQGEIKKAVTVFRRVLKISKFDPIAQKNLAKAQSLKPTAKRAPGSGKKSLPAEANGGRANFLEEPGKTKLISLVNLAASFVLLKQDCAKPLVLRPRRHTVVVEDRQENYLGALPDDLGHRLSFLINGGNSYEAFLKSISKNSVIIFIRETFRARRFRDTPSFLTVGSDYLSFVREDAVVHEEDEDGEEGHPRVSDEEADS